MKRLASVAVASLAAAFALGASGPAFADPPGDNGTIKVDNQPFDTAPNNEPHVGCLFEVDFYGFDLGVGDATVTFTGQSPTGKSILLLTDTVPIGEDAAGGGTDLDAERAYTLPLQLLGDPHKVQGFHVKLTVNAPGSIGADTKYKVFWVTDCEYPPSPY